MSASAKGGDKPDPADDPALRALLAESRAGARAVEEGRFRLDWSKALDKIKRFQLTDPHRYVLELVQAGVATGADQIEVRSDADDMIMSFGGRPFDQQAITRIFDYLFAQDLELIANRQLALGVNAALALRPKFIIVESGDGSAGTRLTLSSHTDFEVLKTTAPDAISGTRIHVRERKGWQVLKEAVGGEIAENALLIEHCTYAPIPLRINGGADLRTGLTGANLARKAFASGSVRGEIVLPTIPLPDTRVQLCTNGVGVVEDRFPPDAWLGGVGATGFVDNARFNRNASHTDIQHDIEYARAVRELRRAVRALLANWAEQTLAREPRSAYDPVELHYLGQTARGLLRARSNKALSPMLERLLDTPGLVELATESPRRSALRPFWEAFGRMGSVPVASRRFHVHAEDLPPELQTVALGRQDLLREIFANKLEDVDKALGLQERALVNRRAREARRQQPQLRPGTTLVSVPLEADNPPMTGELGLHLPGTGHDPGVMVLLLRDGVPLSKELIRDKLVRGAAVVDCPDFRPKPRWDGIEHDDAYDRVGSTLMRAVPDLIAALHESFPELPPPASLALVGSWQAAGGELPADPSAWATDVTAAQARDHLDALLNKAPKLTREQAPWLYDWKLFYSLAGQTLSLSEIEALASAGGGLRYVIEEPWGPGGEGVVNVSRDQRKILKRYISGPSSSGRSRLRHQRAALARAAEIESTRQRNLRSASQRKQPPLLDPVNYWAIIELPQTIARGQIGVPRFDEQSQLRILVDELPLCEMPLGDTAFPIHAVLEAPAGVQANETFSGVLLSDAVGKLVGALRRQCAPLAAELAGPGTRDREQGRRHIWAFLERLPASRRKPLEGIPEALLDVPLVETVAHGRMSLRALHDALRDNKRVYWVEEQADEQLAQHPIVVCRGKPTTLGRLLKMRPSNYGRRLRDELQALERQRQPRRPARLDDQMAATVKVIGPGIEGELGIPQMPWFDDEGARYARVQILHDGVALELRSMDLCGLPIAGVISSARFTPSPLYNSVVADPAWEDGRRALRIAADRLAIEAAEHLLRLERSATPGDTASHQTDRLRHVIQTMAGERFRGRPRLELEGAPEVDWAIARAPAWVTPAGQRISLDEVSAGWQEQGTVWVVGRERGHPAPGRVIVEAEMAWTRSALERIFGRDGVADGRELLSRDEAAHQRRLHAPALAPVLPPSEVLPAVVVEHGDGTLTVVGQVAPPRHYLSASRGIELRIGVEGRLLCSRMLPHPLRGRASLNCRGLTVNAEWTDAASPNQLALLTRLVGEGLWSCLGQELERAEHLGPRVREDRDRLALLFEALTAHLRGVDHAAPAGPSELLDRLVHAPLFSTVRGGAVSAAQLRELGQREGRVLVVDDEAGEGTPQDGRLIVRAGPAALEALETLLGDAIERHDERWRAEIAGQKRRREAPRCAPELKSRDVAAETFFSAGAVSGLAGLLQPMVHDRAGGAGDLASRVTLHVDRRRVTTREPLWHPTVEVWLNDDRLQPTPSFDEVAENDAYTEAMAVAEAQIPELVARAAERWHELWIDSPGDPLRRRLCEHAIEQLQALERGAAADPAGAEQRLLEAPLWKTAGAAALVSTRTVTAALRAGRLATAQSDEARTPAQGAPLVLALDDPTRLLLLSEWGEIADYSGQLARDEARRAFFARPAARSVDLDADNLGWGVVYRRPVTGAGWCGELGLRSGALERMDVAILVEGRRVLKLVIDAPVEAVAVVQLEQARLSDDCTDIARDAAFDAMLSGVQRELLATVCAMADGWPAMSKDSSALARRVLLEAVPRLERAGAAAEAALSKIRALPWLRDLSGREWSLEALAREQQRRGTVAFVSTSVSASQQLEQLERPVLQLPQSELRVVGELLELERFDHELDRLAEAARRRERAPREAEVDWSNTVAHVSVEHGDLTGELALGVPFGRGELVLKSRGRVVTRVQYRDGPGLLGWLDGPITTDRYFETVTLTEAQRQALDRLYEAVLGEAVELALRDPPRGRSRARGDYLALCDYVASSLQRALVGAGSSPDQRRALVLGQRAVPAALGRALKVKLLRLADGSWIDLATAVADESQTLVLCDAPAKDDDDDALLLLAPPGPVRRLLGVVVGSDNLHEHQRWLTQRKKQATHRASKRKRLERMADLRTLNALQGTLRELVSAAAGRSPLSFSIVNQLRCDAQTKRRERLLFTDGHGNLRLNSANPLWAAARAALTEPAQQTPHPVFHLTASVVAELRSTDIGIASEPQVVALLTQLAATASTAGRDRR